MNKKIISFFTALSMTLMLLGTVDIKAEETPVCTGWQEISTSTFPTTPGNYVLTEDSETDVTHITGTVNICLHGHNITTLFDTTIDEGAVLNLYDCKGTGNIFAKWKHGIKNKGTLNMYGGNITGNDDVGVFNSGTFNMHGGKITNNNNVLIAYTFDGGGVYNTGTFNMYNGEISNNTVGRVGGGVFNQGIFNMYGGKIVNNKANSSAGGVCVGANHSFTMSGGEISGNTAAQNGGGICLAHENSKLNVSGKVTVLNNTSGGNVENIYMDGLSSAISIIGSLDENSKLGITTYTIGSCRTSDIFTVTSANAADYSSSFVSDNTDYEIINEGNGGNYLIKLRMPHQYDETVWYKNETSHYNFCPNCITKFNNAEHTYDSGTVTKDPTETEEGVMTYNCTVCGSTKTEPIEKLPPVVTDPIVTDPPATDPSVTEPTVTEPPISEPAVTEPPITEPPVSEPTVTAPPVTEPVVTVPTYVPSHPSNNATAYTAPVQKEPFLQDKNGKIGWDVISGEIWETPDGETVRVNMNGTTKLPKNIISDIAGRDIDLVLIMNRSFTWTINGMSVTKARDVDMTVKKMSKIPKSTVQNFFGDLDTIQLDLRHSGDFGFIAELTVNVGNKYSGMYANSYCYKARNFEFGDSAKVVDGQAKLRFSHASRWLITVENSPIMEDVSSAAGIYENGETDSNIYYVLILAAAAGIAVIAARKHFCKKNVK